MRLLRVGRRLASIGRRIARACGACCRAATDTYTIYAPCGGGDARLYVQAATVTCADGSPLGPKTILVAGFCYSPSGTTKFIPVGATLVTSGTVQCVAGGCADTLCDSDLYVTAYPCKKCGGSGNLYIKASLLAGHAGEVYSAHCPTGPSVLRSQVGGPFVSDRPGDVQFNSAFFKPSCCAACCQGLQFPSNPSCVSGCCRGSFIASSGSGRYYSFSYYNGGRYFTSREINCTFFGTDQSSCTTRDIFIDLTGQVPNTDVTRAGGSVRRGVGVCRQNGGGYTYSTSCYSDTGSFNYSFASPVDPDGSRSGIEEHSTLTHSYASALGCNDCGSPGVASVSTHESYPSSETAGDLL